MKAAHDHGARVTAHVFGEHALPDLIGSGIDCIEHGTGLSSDLVDAMVANGVALVPTVKQLGNFPAYADAGREQVPDLRRPHDAAASRPAARSSARPTRRASRSTPAPTREGCSRTA